MLAMGREIRAHMTEAVSSDLSDLYDEEAISSVIIDSVGIAGRRSRGVLDAIPNSRGP